MESNPRLQDALFEIGTEEIPASYLPPALNFMAAFAGKFLEEKRLPRQAVSTYGTPRRLALLISGVAARSEPIVQEALGPSLAAARDREGQWTQAARGFAQSQGVRVDELQVRPTKKGEYVCAVKKQDGVKAEKLLPALVLELAPAIPFPKKMVWNHTGFKFARPIRSLVALFGHRVLRLQLAGVRSGNKTSGLSHLGPASLAVQSPQKYLSSLRNHCVIADPEQRKQLILSGASALAKRVKGQIHLDASLLEEVNWIVEHPVAVLGSFDETFLELPQEVLITCMKRHQKFFSVLDGKGKLLHHFVGIRNGISEHQDNVRAGYEKVLKARLSDARFFFDEDVKKTLEFYAQKCGQIQVHESLGTLADRIDRMSTVAEYGLEAVRRSAAGASVEAAVVERAIRLSKFDLATRMVYEFPELQGIVGEHYARHFGECQKVAAAIREHYYPLTNQGDLPGSPESSLAALVDKLDGLVGNFLVGLAASGSADPYGLKRQATGVLRILLGMGWDFALKDLVDYAIDQFPEPLTRDPAAKSQVQKGVLDFFRDRFQLLLQDQGHELDEIYAVVQNFNDPDLTAFRAVSLRDKVSALRDVRSHPDFQAVAGAYKRAANILRQAAQKQIPYSRSAFDAGLMVDPAEKDLHGAIESVSGQARGHLERKLYRDALRAWVTVRPELDRFFEKVLVMDPDPKVCSNRLSLLSMLESEFRQLADFSMIQARSQS